MSPSTAAGGLLENEEVRGIGPEGKGQRQRGPLRPGERAQASAMCPASRYRDHRRCRSLRGRMSLLGTLPWVFWPSVPHRVLFAATVAGGLIASLVAGMGGMMTAVQCADIGGSTIWSSAGGAGLRRHRRGSVRRGAGRRGVGGGPRGVPPAARPDPRVDDREREWPVPRDV